MQPSQNRLSESTSSQQFLPTYEGFNREQYNALYQIMAPHYPTYDPMPLSEYLLRFGSCGSCSSGKCCPKP